MWPDSGSEDHLIHCLNKAEPCAAGRDMLAQARQGEQEDDGEAEQQEEDEGEEFENEASLALYCLPSWKTDSFSNLLLDWGLIEFA